MSQANIHFVADCDSPLSAAAEFIIQHSDNLPDLTATQIILSEPRAAPFLRKRLLQQTAQQQALLGPNFFRLNNWLHQYNSSGISVCPEQARQLILVEALNQVPKLLGNANPWTLAAYLLQLFDRLTLNRIEMLDDLEQFAQQLSHWYGLNSTPRGLLNEAQLIHYLWHAWHEQLEAMGMTDPKVAYILALQNSLARPQQHLHLIGIEPQYKVEREWLQQLLQNQHVHLWLHGTLHDINTTNLAQQDLLQFSAALNITPPVSHKEPDHFADCLHTIFNPAAAPLLQRSEQLKQIYPHSPLRKHISQFAAQNAEQEAQAIDIQVRQWLIEGKRHIGIVTENRRLARRLRALLERANVHLQDAAGWALSTTRVAATIEAMLECIETDFSHQALLDFLKSPFLFPDLDRDAYKKLIYRFEHDIIHHEQITHGLQRYRKAIMHRQQRLSELWQTSSDELLDLLERIEDATNPLGKKFKQTLPIAYFLDTLKDTLRTLGLVESFSEDAAGIDILNLVEEMHYAAGKQPFKSNWLGFRAWLGNNLEQHYFAPPTLNNTVQLLSLDQSALQQYDGLIMASTEHEYLPGAADHSPFFNDAVLAELELPTREQSIQKKLRYFYRLLHSAPHILITYRESENAEPILPSPWLSALIEFHRLCYNDDLQHPYLQQWLAAGRSRVMRCDTEALPSRQQRPQPTAPVELLPPSISASAYQQLMDCPYKFFAAQCLKLAAPEEIRQVLSKREFGERVHQCLQAFHSNVAHLPGPFTLELNAGNRAAAIQLLEEISNKVFAYDIIDNYTHRGWQHQWQEVIPVYIDWQIQRWGNAQVHATELRQEKQLNDKVAINGRLDRIDKTAAGYEIIDYKTGLSVTKKSILAGESIQLPFYAWLAEDSDTPVQQVEYLMVNRAKDFTEKFHLKEAELQQLTRAIADRLTTIFAQLHQQQPLPAWENEKTCQYCDMSCLCRVTSWDDANSEISTA